MAVGQHQKSQNEWVDEDLVHFLVFTQGPLKETHDFLALLGYCFFSRLFAVFLQHRSIYFLVGLENTI